ncbi:MAG: hypothetical protein LBK42_10375 [Propionibacteriaceae bacterium]|jgi:phage-related protein|nr:hypothetical protein [Propionibacteriaceae bacterium]
MAGDRADDVVRVRTRPDFTGFDARMRKVTGKRRETLVKAVLDAREAKQDLDKLLKSKAVIDLDARTAEAKKKLESLQTQIKGLADKRVLIDADITEARGQVKRLQAQLAEADDKAKITIKADIEKARAEVKRLTADLQSNRSVTAKVQLDARKAKEELKGLEDDREVVLQAKTDTAAAKAALAVLARRRIVNFVVKINNLTGATATLKNLAMGLSGVNMLREWKRGLESMLTRLPQTTVRLAALAPALASVASVGMTALGSIGPIAASIAQIGPIALGAVPALGALALSAGVLVAAFKDLDAEDASAPVKAFSAAVKDAKSQLSDMRKRIQDTFFSAGGDIAGTFRSLVDQVLPELESATTRVATSLGGTFESVLATVRDGLSAGVLDQFGEHLSQSIDNARAGVSGFVEGLLRIGTVGARVLPDVGTWISDIGQRFAAWTVDADIEGLLRRAAEQAGFLWQAVKDLGGIISGVFRAMSDSGGGLESFSSTLKAIRDVVESPGFQETMRTIFAGAAAGAAALRLALGPVGEALQSMSGLIGGSLESLGKTFAKIVEGIARALSTPAAQDGIAAAIEGIGRLVEGIPWEAFGGILGTIGKMIGDLGPVVGDIIAQLAPAVDDLLVAIEPLIPILGDMIVSLMPAVTSLIEGLIPVIEALAPVLEAIAPIIGPLADLIVSILVPAFADVARIIEIVMPVIEWMSKGLEKLIAFWQDLVNGDWSDAWEKLQEIVGYVSDAVVAIVGGLARMVVNKAKDLARDAGAAIAGWVEDLKTRIKEGWNDAVAAVERGVQDAIDWVRSLPRKAVEALSGIGQTLYSSGRSLLRGFLDGITSMAQSVKDKVTDVLKSIRNLFPFSPAKEGPFSGKGWVLYSGISVGEGLAKGMEAARAEVRAGALGLVSSAQNVFDGLRPSLNADVSAAAGGPGAGNSLTVTFGDVTVRKESDIRAIAQQIADVQLGKAQSAGHLGLGLS